jgi:hypothetical protein
MGFSSRFQKSSVRIMSQSKPDVGKPPDSYTARDFAAGIHDSVAMFPALPDVRSSTKLSRSACRQLRKRRSVDKWKPGGLRERSRMGPPPAPLIAIGDNISKIRECVSQRNLPSPGKARRAG